MPDSKITALTSIGASTDPANDPLVLVDVSDTSMAASGTTKKVTLNQLLGASGTATLASATITGDLTVDTSTLYVSSSTDKVGIGTTSLSGEKLTVAGNISANAWLGRGNIAVPSGDCSIFRSADNTLSFGIASTTAMTLNSTGLGVGVTPSAGKGALQLSSGINFPATQVASSDANTLDDYEEGTWTGTLKGSVSDPTTPVTATGRYTKIGRQVSVVIDFGAFNSTGASGNASIIGLPFANGLLSVGSVESGSALTFSGTLTADVSTGGTTIQLQSITSNAFAVFATHNAGNPRYLTVSINYSV